MSNNPPRFLLRFFRWYCKPALADHIEGDLIEDYRKRLRRMSKRRTDLKFIIDVLLLFRPGIVRQPKLYRQTNQFGMYKNYLKVTFRVFNRERMYSLINLFGLALGFSCCLAIYLFINDELSYDKFHRDADRIYRVSAAYMRQGQWEPYASNSWRTAELFKNNYSEVEQMVRIMPDGNEIVEYGEKRNMEYRMAWVDENFFNVFNFKIIDGNAVDVLKGPNKTVITESMAKKYFADENPVGKTLKTYDGRVQLLVTGVMEDMPSNSHFHFDFLISNATLNQVVPESLFTNVGWDSQFVYVRLVAGANAKGMESTFPQFIDKNLDFWKQTTFKLSLQPLLSIHLESNIGQELEANGSLTRIYTFSVIAIFIMVIACVNYMNLTTARSLRRAKEVGMRKALGAKRLDLVNQFLTESLLMTTIAIAFGMALTYALLPDFNRFAGKDISRLVLISPEIVTAVIGALIVVAFVSGIYPAMLVASFRSMNSMKGEKVGQNGFVLRKGLVLVQFVISIGLIASSVIVFKQWNYLRNKELGINKELVVAVPLQTMDRRQVSTFKQELVSDASIRQVGFSNMRMPGWIGNSTTYTAEDVNADDEVNKSMKLVRVDYDFFPTIQAQLVQGRNFSEDFPADTVNAIMINEAAVAQLRWKDPLNKWIEFGRVRYFVAGVVRDFHFESLHRQIPPTIFVLAPRIVNWAYIKIDPSLSALSLEHLKKVYSRYVTNREFSYTFLDEDIDRQYVAEEKFTVVFTLFTILAIIIACLGTFGMISFSAERKAKEIGIRKVLGASTGNVSYLLIKEFMILLVIASVIAWPVTWYFLKGWVDAFVYRTEIGVVPFILATVAGGTIVIITTGLRAYKAASANPVDSLRND